MYPLHVWLNLRKLNVSIIEYMTLSIYRWLKITRKSKIYSVTYKFYISFLHVDCIFVCLFRLHNMINIDLIFIIDTLQLHKFETCRNQD